jgi:predicted 3-demethylubiquinone-9 3-methyltransferase (glyoxalase superfamily)
MSKITPYLWFQSGKELGEALELYTSLFPDSKVTHKQEIPEGAPGAEAGGIMMATFTLAGQDFFAMNGGPQFKFNESVSFLVDCADQEEVDKYWSALTANGGEESQCGWLKDKFGLSWQIIPKQLTQLMSDPNPQKAQAVMQAMLKMQKIVVKDLEDAYNQA